VKSEERIKKSTKRKSHTSVCKISGKIKLATTVFVVAFDMQKAKKSPARSGARIIKL